MSLMTSFIRGNIRIILDTVVVSAHESDEKSSAREHKKYHYTVLVHVVGMIRYSYTVLVIIIICDSICDTVALVKLILSREGECVAEVGGV